MRNNWLLRTIIGFWVGMVDIFVVSGFWRTYCTVDRGYRTQNNTSQSTKFTSKQGACSISKNNVPSEEQFGQEKAVYVRNASLSRS